MPYTQDISRVHKACFLFLVDQSYGMLNPLGGNGDRKCDVIAGTIDGWLQSMIIRADSNEGVRDWMDIGVIGYRTDCQENPIIRQMLGEKFAHRNLVSLPEIAANARIETRFQMLNDEETGGAIEAPVEVPGWIDAIAEGGSPMCHALYRAHVILQEWIANHPQSFPPLVTIFTEGEVSDGGNPFEYAEALKSLATEDGEVLLFNCHISYPRGRSILFPSNCELLAADFGPMLFHMSSELPKTLFDIVNRKQEFALEPGARGLAYEADEASILKFLLSTTPFPHGGRPSYLR